MNDYTENNQWDQTVYNSKVIVTLFVPLIYVLYFYQWQTYAKLGYCMVIYDF